MCPGADDVVPGFGGGGGGGAGSAGNEVRFLGGGGLVSGHGGRQNGPSMSSAEGQGPRGGQQGDMLAGRGR